MDAVCINANAMNGEKWDLGLGPTFSKKSPKKSAREERTTQQYIADGSFKMALTTVNQSLGTGTD